MMYAQSYLMELFVIAKEEKKDKWRSVETG